MLKESTPKDRLEWTVSRYQKVVEPIVSFASLGGGFVLFWVRNGGTPTTPYFLSMILFLIVAQAFSRFLAAALLVRLTSWLGHMEFRDSVDAIVHPNKDPKGIERFLNVWWNNEVTLNAFLIVFRVTVCVGCYRLLGPMIDIL